MSDSSSLLNTVFLGEVSNVHNYGGFVKIPGQTLQGMVHRSQISSSSVDDASDVLHRGDRVWCKVIGINDDGKISLSMKVVQQGTGKDLDPTGVQIHQDELKRREGPTRNIKKKIELGAVFNTTCSKCGTKGHLAKDCFKSPDGKTYELIPEDDEENVINTVPPPTNILPDDKVKDKKQKKKKQKRSKDKHKEEHRKKKKTIERKRKYSTSSSSSTSDSSSESSESDYKRSTKKSKINEKSKSRKKSTK